MSEEEPPQPWESTTTEASGEGGTKFTYNPEDTRTSNHKNTYVTTWGNTQTVVLGHTMGYTWKGKVDTTAIHSHTTTLGSKTALDALSSIAIGIGPKLDVALAPGIKLATGFGVDIKLFDDQTFKLKEGWKFTSYDKQLDSAREAIAVRAANIKFDGSECAVNKDVKVAREQYIAGLKSEMATSSTATIGSKTYNAGIFSLASPFSSINGVLSVF